MNLIQFLEHKWPEADPADRYREMAKLLGCHRFYVYQMATGRRDASRKMIVKMEQVSEGLITFRDMCPEYPQEPAPTSPDSQEATPTGAGP